MEKILTLLLLCATITSCGNAQKAAKLPTTDSVPVGAAIPATESVPVGAAIPNTNAVPVGGTIQSTESVPVGGSVKNTANTQTEEAVSPARQRWLAENDAILAYCAKYIPAAQYTASGIYYIKTKQGYGPQPTAANRVTVNYTGKFLDGTVFDQGNNVTFPLSGVIAGWTEGLQLVNNGGSITMIIPSYLAYGEGARTGIPANSILVFDVDLVEVN